MDVLNLSRFVIQYQSAQRDTLRCQVSSTSWRSGCAWNRSRNATGSRICGRRRHFAARRTLSHQIGVQVHAVVADDSRMKQRIYEHAAADAGIQDSSLDLKSSTTRGLGLFLNRSVRAGEVLMRIPLEACIVLSRDPELRCTTSWRAPEDGKWKRVEAGLATFASDGLPWDLVCALALVDAAEGNGGHFYGNYQQLLPRSSHLQVPFCLRASHLAELQHAECAERAAAQKQRLATLFPHLMPDEDDEEEDGPGLLQWAFACVRSRAFSIGGNYFAFVPFLDMANHAENPNAAYRPSGCGEFIEVIAVADIKSEQELFISYTGDDLETYTSQRLMAQYGFVVAGGTVADRVQFEDVPEKLQSATLRLETIQEVVGDKAWADMMSRKRNHLYAVLKSLPVSNANPTEHIDGEVDLARELLVQSENALAAFPTTLEEDGELLKFSQSEQNFPLSGAIEFRMQQKIVWMTCKALLSGYVARSTK